MTFRPLAAILVVALLANAGCEGTAKGIDYDNSQPGQRLAVTARQPATKRPETTQASDITQVAAKVDIAEPPVDRGFLGDPEQEILKWMAEAGVVRARKGTGGRSLGFKLYFEGGGKAYFKPEQSFSGALWYAEVAAYYLDRALGLGRVPPVVSRRMPWGRLRAVAGDDKRVSEVVVGDDQQVRGALIWWLPRKLHRAETPPGWEQWIRLESYARWSVSPYQRPAVYADKLRQRRKLAAAGEPAEGYYEEAPVLTSAERAASLSDMIVFDYLTLNIDRWGGNNVNVLTMGRGGPLIFLDNAAGFSVGPHRRSLMEARLKVCQRFRRSTIDALRRLDVLRLQRKLQDDALGPILDEHMIEGIEIRREAVLQHVAQLRKQHGDAVYSW